jgi:hypothetical protein
LIAPHDHPGFHQRGAASPEGPYLASIKKQDAQGANVAYASASTELPLIERPQFCSVASPPRTAETRLARPLVEPIERNISYRQLQASEITEHWSRSSSTRRAAREPKAQATLELPLAL